MKIYRLPEATVVAFKDKFYHSKNFSFDALFQAAHPFSWMEKALQHFEETTSPDPEAFTRLLPPLENQEVWAAGVTYFRSREARMEESQSEKGGDFYDRVYHAERPELFFKATASRVVGHGDMVAIRSDSPWNVPEAEVTLAINTSGTIFGFTIGNDMSSRSLEGENPLYLPQAKTYRRCGSLGPCLLLSEKDLSPATVITLQISRADAVVFKDNTTLSQMKRAFRELTDFLYRDNTFPNGSYLMTGTGIVPDPDFTLRKGDQICITIDPIGTLLNAVQ